MARDGGLIHNKLPYPFGYVQEEAGDRPPADKPVRAEDVQEQLSPAFMMNSLNALKESLATLGRLIQNRGFPVDEYQTGTGSGTIVTLTPTYDFMPERIEAIIITGPPAGVITVQLGDRFWPLVMPAAGVIILAPLGVILSRSDVRQLTAQAAGQYTMELMGYGQRRFDI